MHPSLLAYHRPGKPREILNFSPGAYAGRAAYVQRNFGSFFSGKNCLPTEVCDLGIWENYERQFSLRGAKSKRKMTIKLVSLLVVVYHAKAKFAIVYFEIWFEQVRKWWMRMKKWLNIFSKLWIRFVEIFFIIQNIKRHPYSFAQSINKRKSVALCWAPFFRRKQNRLEFTCLLTLQTTFTQQWRQHTPGFSAYKLTEFA